MSASPATASPPRRRGRDSFHTDAALLGLVAAVVRAVAAHPGGREVAPARVSMAAFNRLRAHADRARGITDPASPERTPTSEAIHLRFNKGAGRKVAWREIVEAALREDPTMWLAALGREPQQPVPPEVVAYALRRVAHALGASEFGREAYRQKREWLIAEDRAVFGEDGLLEQALPTVNQIEGQYGFAAAAAAVGLGPAGAAETAAGDSGMPTRTGPSFQHRGLSLPQAMALYGALNGSWPSRTTLRAFARAAGFAVGNTQAAGVVWDAVISDALALLQAADITPPASARVSARARGERLCFRIPVEGVPGAPPPKGGRRPAANRVASPAGQAATTRHDREADASEPALGASDNDEVFSAKHELYVIAVRVWLAGLAARHARVRSAYASWRRGKSWPSPNRFDEGHGHFSGIRREAEQANRAEKRRSGLPVAPGLLSRAEDLQAFLNPARQRALNAGEHDGAFDLATALRAVVAEPDVEVEL